MKGYKEDTILDWLRASAKQAESIEERLLATYQLNRGQLDALWAYMGNKGEKSYPETEQSGQFWCSTMLDIDTRLGVARGIANQGGNRSEH